MHGTNVGKTERKEQAMPKNQKYTEEVYGQKEQEELKQSYKQSLANREERIKKKYPDKPISQKEWVEGYKEWKKQMEDYGSER
tara:strand:+ start:68 stop:316 length:249 start_codon:yes stop_codon:yes gene_type:complete